MSVLEALNKEYERLADRGDVPPFGYSNEKIGFLIALAEDGAPVGPPIDLREEEGKRRIAPLMAVPASFKRPGVTPRSFFLWDNTAFALGVTASESKDAVARLTAFRERHIKELADTEDVQNDEEAISLRRFMCDNFFDVRTFGAVMSTGINCGQVRGPVQLSFARSIEPVVPLEISITRMAATSEKEKAEREKGDGDERRENRTMGRKHIVPYGLYRAHGFVSAQLAERTGFSQTDLAFLWEALANMFEHDHSAARGEMSTRNLIVFKHASALGNAPAHALFDRVTVGRVAGDEIRLPGDPRLDNLPPARRFSDYRVEIARDGLPEGVEIIQPV